MNPPKIIKLSIFHLPMISQDMFEIMVKPIDFDVARHKIIVQVLLKSYTLERNTLKVKLPITTTVNNHPLQSQLKGNDSLRVKAFIYDTVTEKVIEAKLQEFGMPAPEQSIMPTAIARATAQEPLTFLEYKPNDYLLPTVPVILGWEKPKVGENIYKLREIDYVCVNEAYKHKNSTTYFDLDNNKIILNDNYRPYAFVGSETPSNQGQLAIIENIETGQLFYPKSTDKDYVVDKKGYVAYDAYDILRIPFVGYTNSTNSGTKVYANTECEYFVNDKLIGKFGNCRSCIGLPKNITEKEKGKFTINKKTFNLPLPQDLQVTASDINEIEAGMPVLIDNDRSINRKDTQDQKSNNNEVPQNESAENIFKEIATLWNHYEDALYIAHLTPIPNVLSVPIPNLFEIEKNKLDNKRLHIPSLIEEGTLSGIDEQFIKTFFENKIRGYFNSVYGLYSLYLDENRKVYEKAGSDLLNHFFSRSEKSYYKTKIIADAIYKTESGKERINNMIKLVDQVFQYQLTKPNDKINKIDFLEKVLDNAWFVNGIELETFPSYDFKSLGGSDYEKLGLFCIGGTQNAKVAVKNFKPILERNILGYDAVIIIRYGDFFGVSEEDYTKELQAYGIDVEVSNLMSFNYRGGVMAQWVLQHQYGYQPFNDYLTYQIKMKRTWKR